MNTTSIVPLIDLPFLSSEINDAHKRVTYHARSMLLEAKRAGDALLAAKKLVKHGEFKKWVEENCRCSYPTANRYMKVAEIGRSKNLNLETFEGGMVAFLEAHSTPRKATPGPAPQFSRDDAEYALKLHAMATRGTGPEKVIAASKLDSFAKQFGMVGEEVVNKAHALLPDASMTAQQADHERASAEHAEKLRAAEERLAEMEEAMEKLLTRKAELEEELRALPKAELVDRLVNAYLQMEQQAAA